MTDSPHCCQKMHFFVVEARLPIAFNERFREWTISGLSEEGSPSGVAQAIDFCPWCGVALPSSLRDEWFSEIDKLNLDPDSEDIPDTFRRDSWWRERGYTGASHANQAVISSERELAERFESRDGRERLEALVALAHRLRGVPGTGDMASPSKFALPENFFSIVSRSRVAELIKELLLKGLDSDELYAAVYALRLADELDLAPFFDRLIESYAASPDRSHNVPHLISERSRLSR